MARIMKDSGYSWIGKIPEDWDVRRVKNGFIRKKEEAHQNDPVILSLARAGVKVRDMSNNEGQIAESYYNYNPVMPGDLLLNPMDLYSGANCSISKVSGVISPAYINLGALDGYNPEYYDYYFKTQYWAMAMFAHGKGVSFDNRWTLSPEDLRNYYIPYPSYEEQIRIANYINQKCSAIDSVIEDTEKTIEEYKKLKQSIITEAVTKGIRGERPMKDSGIEWIGAIPEEWDVVKSHRIITSTQNGLTRRDLDKSEGQIVVKLKNINSMGSIDYSEVNRIELSEEEKKTYNLKDGDFLFVRVNGSKSLVGKCAIFFDIGEPVAYNDHIIRVRTNNLIDVMFLHYYLMSDSGKSEIDLHTGTAAGQFTISGDGLREVYVTLPKIAEQEEIVDFIQEKTSKIDTMITYKITLIEELKAYKKSIIYEYVTGKKEVPEDVN